MTRIHYGEDGAAHARLYRMIDADTGEEMNTPHFRYLRWADDETGEYFCLDTDENGKFMMDGDGCGPEPCVGKLHKGDFTLVLKDSVST